MFGLLKGLVKIAVVAFTVACAAYYGSTVAIEDSKKSGDLK